VPALSPTHVGLIGALQGPEESWMERVSRRTR
jgi:hypothetical protein